MNPAALASRPALRWSALGVLSFAVLLVGVDATVLNLAIPEITAVLRPDSVQLLWILDIYSLLLAGLLVSAGALSDRWGRKRVLLIGCSVFGAASAFSAYAPSPELLIATRALMAVGGAFIMPSTLALIRTMFPDRGERTAAIGVWSAAAAAGAAVGPVVGGFLLEHFWWGSVFLINLPVLGVLLVLGGRLLPESRDPDPGRWDIPSAVSSTIGLMSLVYSIKTFAEYGLRVDAALALVIAGTTLSWFVRRQRQLPEPLLQIELFRSRRFTGAVIGNLISLLALSGLLLFVSQYLQLVRGYSPLESGLRLAAMTAGAIMAAPLAPRVAKLGVRWAVAVGLLAATVGMAGFALVLNGPYLAVGVCLFLVGAGVGVALTITSDAILTAAPPERAGGASAISETAYELGTGLGIAVLGSILGAIYTGRVAPPPLPVPIADAVRDSVAAAAAAATELPTALAAQVTAAASEAFLVALRITSFGSAVLLLAAIGVIVTLLRPSGGPDDTVPSASEDTAGAPRSSGAPDASVPTGAVDDEVPASEDPTEHDESAAGQHVAPVATSDGPQASTPVRSTVAPRHWQAEPRPTQEVDP